MAQMLILNPRGRRKARRAAPKAKRRSTSHRRARRHNPFPLALSPARHHRRGRRHGAVMHRRRRRNPIGGHRMGGGTSVVALLKDALIGGAGALAVDLGWGQINPHLPAALQTSQTGVGMGDAVKAGATVLLWRYVKNPTVRKAAMGALITQVRDIASTFVPQGMAVAGLGYFVPGRVVNASARIGPNQAIQRSVSPLLNRYLRPGVTPLLNAAQPGTPSAARPSHSSDTAIREGVRYR